MINAILETQKMKVQPPAAVPPAEKEKEEFSTPSTRCALDDLAWEPCVDGFKMIAMSDAVEKALDEAAGDHADYRLMNEYCIVTDPISYVDRNALMSSMSCDEYVKWTRREHVQWERAKREIRRREHATFSTSVATDAEPTDDTTAPAVPAAEDAAVIEMRRRWTWSGNSKCIYTAYHDDLLAYGVQHGIQLRVDDWMGIYYIINADRLDITLAEGTTWTAGSDKAIQAAVCTDDLLTRLKTRPHVVVRTIVLRPTPTPTDAGSSAAKLRAFYVAADSFKECVEYVAKRSTADMSAKSPTKTSDASEKAAFLARTTFEAQVAQRLAADYNATTFYVNRLPDAADDAAFVAAIRASPDAWSYDDTFPSLSMHAIDMVVDKRVQTQNSLRNSGVLGMWVALHIVLLAMLMIVISKDGFWVWLAPACITTVAIVVVDAIVYLWLQLHFTRLAMDVTVSK